MEINYYESGIEKEKLRTLKEIIVVCDICKANPKNNCHHPCCRNYKKARAEAVKWVKMFRKKKYWEAQVKFMLFFNLTEKDLQSEEDME